jgi:UDP:flavonoid glycosyltransferase YjiC (YdhE family)
MHYLCSNVELVVHHCGSGTYHYPIIHNVPTITIGTKSYDRDDVAARLEELGISIHIPAPDECEDFVGRFKEAVRSYFDESGAFIEAKKRNIDRFKREIEETSSSFNFSELIAGQVAFT